MVMPAERATKRAATPHSRLADPALRRAIEASVRRRVSGPDADDIVQATFADLLSAAHVPEDVEEFRRFVFGVTRNKVFDHFRLRAREAAEDEAEAPAFEPPLAARDMLRWAEQKLPDSEAEHTFEWLLREGDGEKLEHIARDANLPAPRVRQRVSRLRRFLRERWALELGLTALGLVLLATGVAVLYEHRQHTPEIANPELRPEPAPTPQQRGQELRRFALEQCDKLDDRACLAGLDRARALDPAGDEAPEVARARSAARIRLEPAPSPTPSASPSALPVPSATTPRTLQTSMPSLPVAPIRIESTRLKRSQSPAPRGSSLSGSSDSLGLPAPEPTHGTTK